MNAVLSLALWVLVMAAPAQAKELVVDYVAPPTVSQFMESAAFVRAIVGPVGSGKSTACILEIFQRAIAQEPGPDGVRRTRWAIIRNTYPELRDTTRKTFEAWIPDDIGQWKEREFTFHAKFEDVDCEILFRALDTPQDVKKLLSLELTGAYINEAREIPKDVLDVLLTRVGRYPSKKDGGASWFGVIMDTNPWAETSEFYQLFSVDSPPGFEVFEQPSGLADNAENKENLIDGYYERLKHGKSKAWVAEYLEGKYPKADKGSIYGDSISGLKKRGNLCEFDHDKSAVFVFADLGISDAFSLWFMKFGAGRGVEVIDHYEGRGKTVKHYASVIRSRGYEPGLVKLFLPHDARQRNLVTGGSVEDSFKAEFPGKVVIGPPHLVADRLEAARAVLEDPRTRIHVRCKNVDASDGNTDDIDGVKALVSFRYVWVVANKVYKKTPKHDWASHSADSFGYMAIAVQFSEFMTRPPADKKPEPLKPPAYRLEELWKTAPKRSNRI